MSSCLIEHRSGAIRLVQVGEAEIMVMKSETKFFLKGGRVELVHIM